MEGRQAAYWAAAERADRYAAQRIVEELHLAGAPSWKIIEELVIPAQERVGTLWQSGAWAFGREHAVAAINEASVRWLAARAAPPVGGGPVLLVACLDAEEHALVAWVMAEAILSAGHAVRHLPGSTSADLLIEAVQKLEPGAVLLSATLTSSLAAHRPVLATLRGLGVPVLVGGTAWGGDEGRAELLGATAYVGSTAEALAVLAELPLRLEPEPPRAPTPAEIAAAELLTHRLVIAAEVGSELLRRLQGTADRLPAWWPDLDSQLHHILGCVAAAMVTDDATIVAEARAWLTALTETRPGASPVVEPLWELLCEVLLRECPSAVRHLDVAGEGT